MRHIRDRQQKLPLRSVELRNAFVRLFDFFGNLFHLCEDGVGAFLRFF